MDDSLRVLTQKIPKLPTIPPVADKIIQLVSSKAAVVGSIVDTIEKDPAISAKVISFANAAFYRMGQPVTTIQDAVMKIGFDNVKSIALGISLLTLFKAKPGADDTSYLSITRHSMAVGIISKEIADFIGCSNNDDIFTCGLLHDLGFMVMNAFFPEIYARINEGASAGKAFYAVEDEVCGVTHGEIGAWLADKWNLPDNMCEVIRYHHQPAGSTSLAVSIVHLADVLSIKKGFCPVSSTVFESRPDTKALQTLGIDGKRLDKLEARIDEMISQIGSVWP